MARAKLMLAVLAAAGLACSFFPAAEVAAPTARPVPLPTAVEVVQAPPEPLLAPEGLVDLYERVNPGVVTIYVFGPPHPDNIPLGQGSGFVIDVEGHIVTNHHVVEGAEEIEIDFASGFKAWATLLGTDPDSDLAVL
ncbi:MAG: trypsin-like peptidase domain-containing protein, partial [Anaerolineales bacterium]